MSFQGRTQFNHGQSPAIGILLSNLGTPAEPTTAAVRRYLKEFLSDQRVVELPRAIWLPILHGIILNTRPAKSARLYQKIWTDAGSPLACYMEQLQSQLSQQLRGQFGNENVIVAHAMRYGEPSIAQGIQQLLDQGAEKIIILPLYPQYAGSTTGSTFDAVARACSRLRWVPELHFITGYYDTPAYIDACVQQIRQHWATHPRGDTLMFSFHGLPRAHLDNGDPYFCQCHKTARLIAEALQLSADDYQVCFQSRFGKQEWLKPYTDKTLETLPSQGVKAVDVFCPGFATDCLETLEEIALQNKDLFLQAGGEAFHYIPALNDSTGHVNALEQLVAPTIQQWLASPSRDTQLSVQRYQQLSHETTRRNSQ